MRSFLQKIEAEREVLRTVNERLGVGGLHGLSSGAIANWAKSREVDPELLGGVTEIGGLISSMCERSGERDTSADWRRRARVARAVRNFTRQY